MTKKILGKLAGGESLAFDEAAAFIGEIAAGNTSDSQMAAFLTGLRVKGESAEEVAGCISALRQYAVPVPHHQKTVFDCCGTGGDGSNSFNVSTAAAIVVAACGVPTAKHGNRAVSSACGSADILEEAGARIDISPGRSARLLDEIGFCFLFAPLYHPVAKRIAVVRRDLGFRTVFNLIGPLLNPAGATHQIVGTASAENALLLASVAGHFAHQRITSYYNSFGVDEILPCGTNVLCRWSEGRGTTEGLPIPTSLCVNFDLNAIRGGDRKTNLVILQQVLSGAMSDQVRVTALNAAVGLLTVGRTTDLQEGYEIAVESLRSGAAKALFDRYIELSREAA